MAGVALRVNMTGMEQVTKWLRTFPAKVERKYAREALRAGAAVILPEAKSRAPVSKEKTSHPGQHIADTIEVPTRNRTRRGVVYVSVFAGVRNKKGESNKSYIGHLELGHKTRPYTKYLRRLFRKDARRMVQPVKFMEPAFVAKNQEAQDAIRAYFESKMASSEVASTGGTI